MSARNALLAVVGSSRLPVPTVVVPCTRDHDSKNGAR